jgi:F-type H+-transporting ATPase subunit b
MKIIVYTLLLFLVGAIEAVATNTGHEGAHGGFNALPFIFQVINFFLLLLVLYKLALPKTKEFFTDRSREIERSLKEAEEAKEKAEKELREYERKLSALDKEIEEIRDMVEKEGQAEKERIIKEAKKEAELIKKQAEIIAEQEVKKAKQELRREVARLSLERAEKIIKENIDDKDQARLIKEYIKGISS